MTTETLPTMPTTWVGFETSPTVGKLAEALAKAQAEIKGATKDSDNPFFKSKYADLESVWEACRTALTNHGIAVIQGPHASGQTLFVTTMLLHSSGEWARSTLSTTLKDQSPQVVGSATTYLRRYGLSAMAGVAPKDDDDGNAAQGNTGGPVTRAARREAAQDASRRDAAENGPYAERERQRAADKTTGEVLRADDDAYVMEGFDVLMARRAKLPAELQAVIPTDDALHAIPPGEAMDNVPFMVDAIVRKAKERKISPKEWGEIMERFFGSKTARLLNNQQKPSSKLNPFFVHALYLEMDMAR